MKMETAKRCFLAWFATLVFSATAYAGFVNNGNGTVTDTSTGLTWEIKTDDGGARDKDNKYTWRQALSYCENLNLAGHTDWRLPDREELRSIVDYSKYNPAIDETYFPNTQSSSYWSSSPYAGNAGYAWSMYFFSGYDNNNYKSYSFCVRAVRGGQFDPGSFDHLIIQLGNPSRSGIASPIAGFGVNAVNGNFFHEEVDATMPGKDIPFVFSRAYNSLSDDKDMFGAALPIPLGPGWTHSYNMVVRTDGTDAEVVWGDGRHDTFTNSGGAWHGSSPGNFATLKQVSGGWELKSKGQLRYRFDGSGRLTSIVGRSDYAVNLTYTGSNLTGIADTAGRSITLSYSGGLLQSVSLPPSRSFSFQYSGGLLASVTDMRGNSHQYVYTNGKLRQIFSANTATNYPLLQNTYDDEGRVEEQESQYNLANSQTGSHLFTWSDNGLAYRSPTGKGADYAWDDRNRATSITPVNNPGASPIAITYKTDLGPESILPQSSTDFNGSQYAYVFDGPNLTTFTDPLSQNHEHTFNDTNDLTGMQTPAGMNATVTPTAFGKPDQVDIAAQGGISDAVSVDFAYSSGRFKQFSIPGTARSEDVKTEVGSYHADGQPLTVYKYKTESDKLTTTYAYDAAGRRKGVKDHRGTWTCIYYDKNDNVTDNVFGYTGASCPATPPSASASIRRIHFEYDADNKLVLNSEGYGSGTRRDITYSYDDNSGVLHRIDDHGGSRTVNYTYDGDLVLNKITEDEIGRDTRLYRHSDDKVRIVSANHNQIADTLSRIKRSAYDPNGRLVAVASCNGIEPGTGECTGATERLRIIRDVLGRPTQIKETVAPGEYRVTNYSYSSGGRIVTVKKGVGVEQTTDIYEYDALGRLIRVNQDGNDTTAQYDGAGRLLTLTDSQGLTTRFSYDGLGRVVEKTDIQGTVSWVYNDASGTVTRSQAGVSVTYTYNRLNELTKIQTSDGNTFTYGYDARGRLVSETWSGTGGSGSRTYAYNVYGEPTSVTGPFGKSIAYTWDNLGRITGKSFSGNSIGYVYDGLDNIKRMTTPAGTFNFTYDLFTAALASTKLPNGKQTSYGRNLLGELVSMNYDGTGDSAMSYDLTLDSLGRRESIDAVQPRLPIFQVEELNLAYTANPDGQLSSINGNGVTHDNRGNITELPQPVAGTYGYDALNRLTSATGAQYRYDTARNRIAAVENGTETRYFLDLEPGLADVVATMNTSGNIQEIFIHGPGGLLASKKSDGQIRYVHQDFNQNAVALTDNAGNLTASFAYTPQGKPAGSAGETDFPFQFAGGVGAMTDADGLVYMRARYYNPQIRQFTSPDLVAGIMGRPQSLGRYSYVEGMALGGVDPSGFITNPFTNSFYSPKHSQRTIDNMLTKTYTTSKYDEFRNQVIQIRRMNVWSFTDTVAGKNSKYKDITVGEAMDIFIKEDRKDDARKLTNLIYDSASSKVTGYYSETLIIPDEIKTLLFEDYWNYKRNNGIAETPTQPKAQSAKYRNESPEHMEHIEVSPSQATRQGVNLIKVFFNSTGKSISDRSIIHKTEGGGSYENWGGR